MFSSAIIIFSFFIAGTFGHTCTSTSGNHECLDDHYCCGDGCCASKGFAALYAIAAIGGIAVLVLLIAMMVNIIKSVASGCGTEDASLMEPDTESDELDGAIAESAQPDPGPSPSRRQSDLPASKADPAASQA